MRAVCKLSQHLVLQEKIVSKTGEKFVSARIVIDEPNILDENQILAIKSIVDRFNGASGDKAKVAKKRILHKIAGLLEVDAEDLVNNGGVDDNEDKVMSGLGAGNDLVGIDVEGSGNGTGTDMDLQMVDNPALVDKVTYVGECLVLDDSIEAIDEVSDAF